MQSLLEELLRYRTALAVEEELGRLCKAHLPSSSSLDTRGLLPGAIFEGHQNIGASTPHPLDLRHTEPLKQTREWVHPILDVRRQANVVEAAGTIPTGAARLRLVGVQYVQDDIRGLVEPLEVTNDTATITEEPRSRSVSLKHLRLATPEPFYHDALLPALEAIEPHHASKNVYDLCLNKLCGAANKMDTSFNQKCKLAWRLSDEVTDILYIARKQLAQRMETVQMRSRSSGGKVPWELKVHLESGDTRLLGILESTFSSNCAGESVGTAVVVDLVRGVEDASEWVCLWDWLTLGAPPPRDPDPLQRQHDVEWVVLNDSALRLRLPLSAAAVIRLYTRFNAQHGAVPANPELFLHALARLLLRYHGLSGGKVEKESGWQAAVPPSVMDVFERHDQGSLSKQRPTVVVECFSSPFNATRPFFFSVFLDTDAEFGSLGNFFSCRDAAACIAAANATVRSSSGALEDVESAAHCASSGNAGTASLISHSHYLLRLECNPPFDHEVIAAAFVHLQQWIESAPMTIAVSILVIIPDSKQMHAAQVRAAIEQSRFCRWVQSLPPQQCLYIHGAHHHDPYATDAPNSCRNIWKCPRDSDDRASSPSQKAAVASSLIRLSCPTRLMVIQDNEAERACPGSEIGADVSSAWSKLSNAVFRLAR